MRRSRHVFQFICLMWKWVTWWPGHLMACGLWKYIYNISTMYLHMVWLKRFGWLLTTSVALVLKSRSEVWAPNLFLGNLYIWVQWKLPNVDFRPNDSFNFILGRICGRIFPPFLVSHTRNRTFFPPVTPEITHRERRTSLCRRKLPKPTVVALIERDPVAFCDVCPWSVCL